MYKREFRENAYDAIGSVLSFICVCLRVRIDLYFGKIRSLDQLCILTDTSNVVCIFFWRGREKHQQKQTNKMKYTDSINGRWAGKRKEWSSAHNCCYTTKSFLDIHVECWP